MGTKGYHSYRGRRGGRRLLGIVLLVLILAVACVYLFLQRYVTFTDNGEVRLDLPFFQKEDISRDDSQGDEDKEDVNLVIDGSEEDTGSEDAGGTAAEPYGEHRLIQLSTLPPDGDALGTELSAQGANGFVYTVKDNTGRVFYDSAMAIQDAVVGGGADTALLSALCGQEAIISVAKLNCFHDSYYAFAHMESAGICQSSGYIWYDNLSYHWLDPAKEQARRYVIDLALECARMGFDELLLDDFHYPREGRMSRIKTDERTMTQQEALALLADDIHTALERAGYKGKLSVSVDADIALAGSEEKSGIVMSELTEKFDRVYVKVTADQLESVTEAMKAYDVEFIPIVTEATDSGSYLIEK